MMPQGIVWSTVSENDFHEAEAEAAETEGLIDELMSNAPGAEVVLLLKQKGDLVSGSLRTTTPAVSASEIAGIFGGGGHLQAAGFKIPNSKVESSVAEILAKIRKFQAERLNLISEKSEEKTEEPKEKLYSKKKKLK